MHIIYKRPSPFNPWGLTKDIDWCLAVSNRQMKQLTHFMNIIMENGKYIFKEHGKRLVFCLLDLKMLLFRRKESNL